MNNKSQKAKVIAALSLVAIAAFLLIVYNVILKQSGKDSVNTIASAIGIQKIIPWKERALTATKSTIDLSRENIASSVIGLSHPTAKKPVLESFLVTSNDEIICVRFQFSFIGGFSGSEYKQVGEWKFSKNQNFGYLILSDNAPFPVSRQNEEKINSYFLADIYPVTLGNIR